MAKTTKKTIRTNKKNKLHLKKSARWTIAGLMLATAIIIALIPVQNGGVQAITSYTVPSTIEEVLGETGSVTDHGFVTGTSVSGTGGPEYAFPLDGNTYTVNAYDDSGNSIGTYLYANIDMTTMDVSNNPVPTYELVKTAGDRDKCDCIKEYLGVPGSGSSPKAPEMKMTLGATVIV